MPELLDEGFSVPGRGFLPRLAVEHAAPFADDGADCAPFDYVACFRGHFFEFVGHASDDLLGALRFVCVGEGVVFMRIDDDGIRGTRDAISGLRPCHRGFQVPCVADVDGDSVVDARDGADDVRVPVVHSSSSPACFVADLDAYAAFDFALGDCLDHEHQTSFAEIHV